MAFTRKKLVYKPGKTYTLSRSKVDLFIDCPRCAYLDMVIGVGRPSFPAFTLNNAVDALLKKECDQYRALGEPHPIALEYGLELVPFNHPQIEVWRDALRHGIKYHHIPSDLLLRGGIDDVWVDPKGVISIVDYKATAGKKEVTLDDTWKLAYKRQAEVYQWLFKQNGFKVSDTAYFLYANGDQSGDSFDAVLTFDMTLLPYTGNTDWVPEALMNIRAMFDNPEPPQPSPECEYCGYREAAGKELLAIMRKNKS